MIEAMFCAAFMLFWLDVAAPWISDHARAFLRALRSGR